MNYVSLEKPTEEQKQKYKKKMHALLEFFEINDIDPSEATTMCMRVAIAICQDNLNDEQMLKCFEIMIKAVKGEEMGKVEL